MTLKPAFLTLFLVSVMAACAPADETPPADALPLEPTVQLPAEPAATNIVQPEAIDTHPLALTAFTPATNEIYCSFFTIGDDGLRGERVFVTEIAGVPAPAHVGLEGQGVALTQVAKDDDGSPQIWVYENADRDLLLEMRLTETAKGFESRDYEGTIEVVRPEPRPVKAVSGTCGV